MMSDYTYIYIIIAVLVIVKLTVWLCIYAARAQRRSRAQQAVIIADGCAVPPQHGGYSQRSAILDYEELPQPIITVPDGQNMPPNYSHIIIQPPSLPSYATAVGGTQMGVLPDKPPSYEVAITSPVVAPHIGMSTEYNSTVPSFPGVSQAEQATEAGPAPASGHVVVSAPTVAVQAQEQS